MPVSTMKQLVLCQQVSALLSKLPAQKSYVTSSSTSQNLSDGVKRKSDAGDDYEPDNGNSEESDEFVDALSDQPLETSRTTADSFGNPNVQFERLHQILGSVCYGYGCFHLMLSLLPGNLLKWLKYLGFEGDLNTGIQALTYCMNSPDSKALLARYWSLWTPKETVCNMVLYCRITLIWFYTIIQTYYAVQEREMEEGNVVVENRICGGLRASGRIFFVSTKCITENGSCNL